jgi:hypothetical protein
MMLLEREGEVPPTESGRETPRSRAARERSLSSARASVIVTVFFLESAIE